MHIHISDQETSPFTIPMLTYPHVYTFIKIQTKIKNNNSGRIGHPNKETTDGSITGRM